MKNDLIETMSLISAITEYIIKIIESDDYSNLQAAFKKRQQALDLLENLGSSKEEYKEAEKEFGVKNLEQKLFNLMDNRKSEIMEKLQDLSKNKLVTKSYNHNSLTGSKIFSKKI